MIEAAKLVAKTVEGVLDTGQVIDTSCSLSALVNYSYSQVWRKGVLLVNDFSLYILK